MDLILVRHGLPERSAVTSDPPLSEIGRAQAARVGDYLGREKIDAIWTSTMRRAIETAGPLASVTGLTPETHGSICEYDRRSGEYVPEEVLKLENYEAWQALAAGDVGVDFDLFQREVVGGVEHIIGAHPGARVVVFCHGGVINVWAANVLGMPARLFFNPGYASVSRFACSRAGHRSVVTLNEHAHLREPGARLTPGPG
jgi:probable phosphoglycerate mutase